MTGQRRLTHVDDDGAARMVDVTAKPAAFRHATASAIVRTTTEVIELVTAGGLAKGDALACARIAGIQGAKRTSDLIPLCHQLALTGVEVGFIVGQSAIEVTAEVSTTDRTGVEMEALTAVSVAALTIYDMVKAVDPAARIDDLHLVRKEGGKSGVWTPPR